jgi:serine/threonine protein kinase/tetratricopeptide (TPR) repeat protein
MDRQTSPMTADKWMQLKKIFEAAQGKPAAEQADVVCALAQGDEELESAARDLLAADESASSFLQAPATDLHSALLAPGTRLGPYQILGLLGEGGMGKVYRGLDTRLGRAVAIKISAEQFGKRFELEARAISALNHPNICTLYDVGPNYLVTELVEGETLRDWLQHPPALERRLEIMRQVLEALRTAHCAGIVHRDLKPQNIMVRFDGYVKVLDFGLAKQLPTARSAQRETIASEASVPGQIVGTVAYMSPEQIQGHPVDQRSDLFAVGIILFEMLTGQHPWPRASMVDTLHAILHDDAPTVHATTPSGAELAPIVRKLLRKNPVERYSLAEGVLEALNNSVAPQRSSASIPTPELRAGSTTWKKWIFACVIFLLLLVAGGAYLFFSRSRRVLTENDTVVLADFANSTGDPVFDDTLRQGMTVQLEQSPFLSLISEPRIQQVLQMMGQPVDTRLTPEIAREVCERTASAAVLDGSIASLGSQYVLGLRAKDCRTGNILVAEQAQAARKEDVLNSLSQIASRFRTRVGESLTTVEKYDTPLAEATTPSLEALKAYSAGWKVFSSTGHDAALPFFKRAIELDPKFAMAHASLGRMYSGIEEPTLSAESITRAYQLRDRASDREKFFITANYDLQVTGNLERGQQTCQLWAQAYPREARAHGFLGSLVYLPAGRYEKAVEESRKAIELDPDLAISYAILGLAYQHLDRLEDAENTLQRASERHLEIPDFFVQRYDLAFLKGDKAGMERAAALSQGKPGAEDWIANHQAFVLAYSGHLEQARKMSRHAVDLAQPAARPERAALFEAPAALREGFFGNTAEARRDAMAALELSKGLYVEFGAAFALGLSGDSVRSQILADDLESRFGEDTSARFSHLPALRALLALNHGEPAKAIKLLQIAVPYDLSAPRSSIHGNFGALYPIYVRGEAYLALDQGVEAATEFQKILDHRGIVVSDPIGALAHLQLGRAYALSGDTAKAKTAYQDFLTLWKDADQDLPILIEARKDYAALH